MGHVTADNETAEQTFYEAVGGHETFVRLVDRFYAGVADDPILRPLYPEDGPPNESDDVRGAKHSENGSS